MSNGEDNVRITYGVKELLSRIDVRLQSIDSKLDAKVDIAEFKILADRVEATVRRIDAQEQRLTLERADRERRFTFREKALALALAVVAVVIQFWSNFFHHIG